MNSLGSWSRKVGNHIVKERRLGIEFVKSQVQSSKFFVFAFVVVFFLTLLL